MEQKSQIIGADDYESGYNDPARQFEAKEQNSTLPKQEAKIIYKKGYRYVFGGKYDSEEVAKSRRASAQANQAHGNTVVTIEDLPCDADAIVTNYINVPIAVYAADCVPLLFYDPVSRSIGAAHCGRLGVPLNIAAATVRKLSELYDALPADLHVFIGPAICGECYEVGVELVNIARTGLPDYKSSAGLVPGKPKNVDLRPIIVEQLKCLGVKEIDVSTDCTAHMSDRYCSRRAAAAQSRPYRNNISIIELLDLTTSRVLEL